MKTQHTLANLRRGPVTVTFTGCLALKVGSELLEQSVRRMFGQQDVVVAVVAGTLVRRWFLHAQDRPGATIAIDLMRDGSEVSVVIHFNLEAEGLAGAVVDELSALAA